MLSDELLEMERHDSFGSISLSPSLIGRGCIVGLLGLVLSLSISLSPLWVFGLTCAILMLRANLKVCIFSV